MGEVSTQENVRIRARDSSPSVRRERAAMRGYAIPIRHESWHTLSFGAPTNLRNVMVGVLYIPTSFTTFAPGLPKRNKMSTARMAELVDALVSNTNGVTPVPVRSRLRALCFLSE